MAKKITSDKAEEKNERVVATPSTEEIIATSDSLAPETTPETVETTTTTTTKEHTVQTPMGDVKFDANQMQAIQHMIDQAASNRGKDHSFSVYGQRDKYKIETVNVNQFAGKFVMGYKDLNTNPFRKEPKYSENKLDVSRKLADQPFVTLLLSSDGYNIEEKEVSLIDYMHNRTQYAATVVHQEKQEVIRDHGVLGAQSDMAVGVDDNNRIMEPMRIKAESKELKMTFYVELPGFPSPVKFTEEFLG